MSPSCMRHFAVQMHYNGDDGSALIFVCWMYGTGVALAVHEQRVRLYCFVCVIAFEGVINWCLTQYEVVILPILLSKCTTMTMMTLR